MMKAIFPVVAVILMVAADASASYVQENEIPLKSATMEAVVEEALELSVPQTRLTLYGMVISRKPAVKPTVFVLSQNGEPLVFDIVNSATEYGVTRYTALERSLTDDKIGAPRSLEVIEYHGVPRGEIFEFEGQAQSRVRFRWLARVLDGERTELELGGNPAPLRLQAN